MEPRAFSNLCQQLREVAAQESSRQARAARIAQLLVERLDVRWAGIYSVFGGKVINEAWHGPGPPAHPTFPVEQGLTAHAIRRREVVVSNDVAADERYLSNQPDSGSELIAPVSVEETVVGTLDVESEQTDAFRESDRLAFAQLAGCLRDLWAR
jgi:L-methionine (R)-S-oxide reductase